jgi:hypothetical protein
MCDACAALFHSAPDCVEPTADAAPVDAEPTPIPIDDIPTEIETRPSGFAQASVLLGLWGFLPFYFIGLFCVIPGLICGAIALRRIALDPLRYGGRRFAVIGMSLSAVALLGWAIFIPSVIMPRFTRAAKQARETIYVQNLQKIELAIEYFHSDTGLFPGTLEDLCAANQAGVSNTADLPADSYKGPYLTSQQHGHSIPGTTLPPNPFANGDAVDDQWEYDPETGTVTSAVQVPAAVEKMIEKQGPEAPEQ